jgi:RNA polymerase sigma-70 factor, ECF subfamily
MNLAYQSGLEDAETLAAAKPVSGSEDEFSLLVYRQNRFVFRVAYAMLRNVQDAEDVAQETFLKLHRNGGWRGIRDERAFLARIAWRAALDRRRLPVMEASVVEPDETPSRSASPEEQMLGADTTASIHRLIDALPEELRQPLVLTGIDEMTSREIAKVLGVAEGTVRTRLQRARKLLREKLAVRTELKHGR